MYKRKINDKPLFKNNEEIKKDTEMIKNNSKSNKIIHEKSKNNNIITYEIEGNDSKETKQLPTIETNSKKQKALSIIEMQEIPVKMILGSPQKVRATASRIIKLGAKGKIPQTLVNSLIWQLRSLVYFDTIVADLSYIQRIETLEKELKKANKNDI